MWEKPVYTFNNQLKQGNKGELFFLESYKNSVKSEIFDYDIISGNKKIELKSESRSLKQTPNFFVERYSNFDTKKDGGPWQANKKADFFVYLFYPDKTFFWFKTVQLLDFMNKNLKNLEQKIIRNPNYCGLGYIVPRETVKHIIWKTDIF
jgi:hypothetical protein